MNDNYHRLWILLQSKITWMAKGDVMTEGKRATLHEILAVMAILEADVMLGE